MRLWGKSIEAHVLCADAFRKHRQRNWELRAVRLCYNLLGSASHATLDMAPLPSSQNIMSLYSGIHKRKLQLLRVHHPSHVSTPPAFEALPSNNRTDEGSACLLAQLWQDRHHHAASADRPATGYIHST